MLDEQGKKIAEANKLMTIYTLHPYLKEWFKENKESSKLLRKYKLYGLLMYEYSSKSGNFSKCNFSTINDDYNNIACFRYGIPAQIVYQSICDEDSPFQKYTVKKLKNLYNYIRSKLNDDMDDTILDTYNKYTFLPIKFELDYLKATYFKIAITGANIIKPIT